jgi:hypothetical protein
MILVKRRTGGTFGDAILAGVITGVLKDFNLTKVRVGHIDHLEPDRAHKERYYMENSFIS